MQLHHLCETGVRRAVGEIRPALRPRRIERDALRKRHHPRRQFDGKVDYVLRFLRAFQHFYRLFHLESVADRIPKRLVHRRHKRSGLAPRRLRAVHQSACKRERIGAALHERARAALHVEHQRARALGKFLRKDGADDERNGRNRSRHVAQCVEFLVRRRDLGGLRGDGYAARLYYAAECVERQTGVVARNGLHLVHRAAGETEAAPGERRYGESARGGERLDYEGELVADAAGGVLVRRQALPRQAFARMLHGVGERVRLGGGHPAAANGHCERRHLVVRHVAARVRRHEFAYLVGRKLAPLALSVQEKFYDHGIGSLSR